jgi:hypothetical protein
VRALHFAPAPVNETRFSLPQLTREFAPNPIDRDVQIVRRFGRIDVLACNREMHFGAESLLRVDRVVMNQDDMRRNDFREILELADDAGDVLMQRGGEAEMTGAQMNLHGSR